MKSELEDLAFAALEPDSFRQVEHLVATHAAERGTYIEQVKRTLAQGGRGGGFLLSDNHGEIPWQVSEDTLLATAEAARRWGQYPLSWIEEA